MRLYETTLSKTEKELAKYKRMVEILAKEKENGMTTARSRSAAEEEEITQAVQSILSPSRSTSPPHSETLSLGTEEQTEDGEVEELEKEVEVIAPQAGLKKKKNKTTKGDKVKRIKSKILLTHAEVAAQRKEEKKQKKREEERVAKEEEERKRKEKERINREEKERKKQKKNMERKWREKKKKKKEEKKQRWEEARKRQEAQREMQRAAQVQKRRKDFELLHSSPIPGTPRQIPSNENTYGILPSAKPATAPPVFIPLSPQSPSPISQPALQQTFQQPQQPSQIQQLFLPPFNQYQASFETNRVGIPSLLAIDVSHLQLGKCTLKNRKRRRNSRKKVVQLQKSVEALQQWQTEQQNWRYR